MRKRRAMFAAGVCLLALGLAVGAWAAGDEVWTAPARAAKKTNPVAPDDQSLAAGKALYVKNCLSCHGATGVGNGPAAKDLEKSPGDLSKADMNKQTDGALFWKLTTGKKPMPAFETLTTEQERWEIVNYVRTLAPKAEATTSQPSSEKK
jgi:mono/diheme cytochrome c family protein